VRVTCPLCAISRHSTALFDYLVITSAGHGFTTQSKGYSISHLAMRLMLSCRAVNRIAAQSYKPTFFVSVRRLPEKDKIMLSPILGFIQHWARYGRVVQELSCLSDRELADIGVSRCDIDRIARGQSRW